MEKNLALDTIMKDTLWVAKMQGWRRVGTYDEISHLMDDKDCRDFDTLCSDGQPEHLRRFYEQYYAYCRKHGIMTIPEYYEKIWAKE